MYEYLKGIITKITAKYIVLEANGIGYILHVANPYAYSGQVNQETQIYVPKLSVRTLICFMVFAQKMRRSSFLV